MNLGARGDSPWGLCAGRAQDDPAKPCVGIEPPRRAHLRARAFCMAVPVASIRKTVQIREACDF